MPSKKELLDLQFIDARHKLIDLAAFLDRIDRHDGEDDYRFAALKNALPILLSDRPDRARAGTRDGNDQREAARTDHAPQLGRGAPAGGAANGAGQPGGHLHRPAARDPARYSRARG